MEEEYPPVSNPVEVMVVVPVDPNCAKFAERSVDEA